MTTTTALTTTPASDYRLMQLDPASIAAALRDNIGDEGLKPSDLDRIAVPAGGATVWQVPTAAGPKNVESIEGVIVARKNARAWWEGADPNGAPPDCAMKLDLDQFNERGEPLYAAFGVGRFGPSSSMNPSGKCNECPQNVWGSGKNGVGKGCKQKVALYIVRPTSMLPCVISAPPTSLRALRRYMIGGLANEGFSFSDVITRFSLTQKVSKAGQKYAEITPLMVAPLSADERAKMRAYRDGLAGALLGGASADSDATEMIDE